MLTVTFDNTDIRDFDGVKLVSYQLPVAPSLKTVGIDVPGAHGVYRTPSPYAADVLLINIVVEAYNTDAVNQRLREFLTWIANKGDSRIVFSDDSTVFRIGKYQTADTYKTLDAVHSKGILAQLTFHLADPFVYGRTINSVQSQLAASGGTFTITNQGLPTWYNLYYSRSSITPTSLSLSNDLIMPTAVNLTPNYTLTIENGVDEYYTNVGWAGVLGTSDLVLISTENYSVYRNGQIDIQNFTGERMAPINTGTNTIRLSNTQSQNVYVRIEWYTRYL